MDSTKFDRSPTEGAAPAESITLPDTLRRAEGLLPRFRALMAEVAFDGEGIPMSEMLFLLSALGDEPLVRILESGRGGGQSTHVLGQWFSNTPIISVEDDERSPRSRAAVARLAYLVHVECRFGDARHILPEILQPGDVVLIDGPKEFRALKLAFQLLQTGRPRAVFIHDLHPESPARRFLAARLPTTFYSSDPAFETHYASLDQPDGLPPTAHWLKKRARGYGPTLACLPGGAAGRAGTARLSGPLKRARWLAHARDKWHSFRGILPVGQHDQP